MKRPITRSPRDNPSLHRTVHNCNGDVCECLAEKIDKILNENSPHRRGDKGLKQHFAEQIGGQYGPNTDEWIEHDENIRDQQQNLRDHLDEYDAQGCGGGGTTVPVDARNWSTRPRPADSDWQGGQSPMSAPSGGGLTLGQKLAVGGLVVGAGVLAVIPFDGPFGEAALGAAALGILNQTAGGV